MDVEGNEIRLMFEIGIFFTIALVYFAKVFADETKAYSLVEEEC